MVKATQWQDEENAGLVALYFVMLDKAMAGEKFNKAALIRDAQNFEQATTHCDYTGVLDTRSKGSIEFKLMNASAAHHDCEPLGTSMDGFGYRALFNYQAGLKVAMAKAIAVRADNEALK